MVRIEEKPKDRRKWRDGKHSGEPVNRYLPSLPDVMTTVFSLS
jgi:hypothetical protein